MLRSPWDIWDQVKKKIKGTKCLRSPRKFIWTIVLYRGLVFCFFSLMENLKLYESKKRREK